ncbi:MAG: cysteine dioxygenase [Sciscionella sp.]
MTAVATGIELHPELDHPLLRDLLPEDRLLWNPRQLRDLTMTVTTELTNRLLGVVQFETKRRWWSRLALTSGVELWLLSWLPGQRTAPHDHGGSSCSFTVLLGTLHEQYRYPRGPIREVDHYAGVAIGFGAGRAHQLGNSGAEPAASVHAYSPPLVPTREYASLADLPTCIPPLPVHRPFAELAAEPAEP